MFKISRRVVGLWLCFQFLTLTSSFSFEDVTGKWNCNGKGLADEDVQFVLELKQSGETVTGTVTIMGGDTYSISKGTIQGNKLELINSTDDNRFISSVTVEKNKMTATWKDETGRKGTWEGERETQK